VTSEADDRAKQVERGGGVGVLPRLLFYAAGEPRRRDIDPSGAARPVPRHVGAGPFASFAFPGAKVVARDVALASPEVQPPTNWSGFLV